MTAPKKYKYTSARQVGGDDGYCWAVFVNGKMRINGLMRSEVAHYRDRWEKEEREKHGIKEGAEACRCRPPKRHVDCLYCGMGGPCTHVCGVCSGQGIDGPVIRGTSRVVCSKHKVKQGE